MLLFPKQFSKYCHFSLKSFVYLSSEIVVIFPLSYDLPLVSASIITQPLHFVIVLVYLRHLSCIP